MFCVYVDSNVGSREQLPELLRSDEQLKKQAENLAVAALILKVVQINPKHVKINC